MKPKRSKVLFSLVLALVIIFNCSTPASAMYFSDVTRDSVGSEVFDAINYVTDNGLMVGMEDDLFEPNTSLTRGMIVTILYRYAGVSGTYNHPFTDVASNRYYSNPIGWAYTIGLASGITDTTFAPDQALNREQLLTFLYRYATICLSITYSTFTNDITGYSDYANVGKFARTSYQWA